MYVFFNLRSMIFIGIIEVITHREDRIISFIDLNFSMFSCLFLPCIYLAHPETDPTSSPPSFLLVQSCDGCLGASLFVAMDTFQLNILNPPRGTHQHTVVCSEHSFLGNKCFTVDCTEPLACSEFMPSFYLGPASLK